MASATRRRDKSTDDAAGDDDVCNAAGGHTLGCILRRGAVAAIVYSCDNRSKTTGRDRQSVATCVDDDFWALGQRNDA